MATERRLIDAKPLMQSGWHLVKTGKSNAFLAQMSLADVPTVDAVEVVRCKDCKYYPNANGITPYCTHEKGISLPQKYDFCSYGERKDNDTTKDKT